MYGNRSVVEDAVIAWLHDAAIGGKGIDTAIDYNNDDLVGTALHKVLHSNTYTQTIIFREMHRRQHYDNRHGSQWKKWYDVDGRKRSVSQIMVSPSYRRHSRWRRSDRR